MPSFLHHPPYNTHPSLATMETAVSSTNGHAYAAAIRGSQATADKARRDWIDFSERFMRIQDLDDTKNILLKDLLSRYELLQETHIDYVASHQRAGEDAMGVGPREQALRTEVTRLKSIMNRSPFVLVLLDCDSMVFNPEFLRAGEAGGEQAAMHLHATVVAWVASSLASSNLEIKVVVRIYVHLHALAIACAKAGLVNSTTQVVDFFRGFTNEYAAFDFVDLEQSKLSTDAKMIEQFDQNVHDFHCRHILLGCSADGPYGEFLQKQTTDKEAMESLTLLQGPPWTSLTVIQFKKTKFGDLFHDTSVHVDTSKILHRIGTQSFGAIGSERKASSTSNDTGIVDTPLSSTAYSPLSSPMSSLAQPSIASATTAASHLRVTSTASSGSTPNPDSWAARAKRNAAAPTLDLSNRPATTTGTKPTTVQRNRAGQRIDSDLSYDRDKVQILKKFKLCNQHYIGGGCCHLEAGREDKCPHKHQVKISAEQRYCLRVVARETPCRRGTRCEEVSCIYGHHCPFPVATEGSLRGGAACMNGEQCRFPREMHGVDAVPVKTVLVTGAF